MFDVIMFGIWIKANVYVKSQFASRFDKTYISNRGKVGQAYEMRSLLHSQPMDMRVRLRHDSIIIIESSQIGR